ncbi:hypothetical protein [Pontibacter harenae]|uniref:hypothetical protein n=1 Tax=Pontibacter harenae TaxID=2894083 RepID=UPI001E2A5486|nr:hypothetical protein [Pontibacter harenae]MCC9168042.1 hypothetical protein [Pontibacter harenae]
MNTSNKLLLGLLVTVLLFITVMISLAKLHVDESKSPFEETHSEVPVAPEAPEAPQVPQAPEAPNE